MGLEKEPLKRTKYSSLLNHLCKLYQTGSYEKETDLRRTQAI